MDRAGSVRDGTGTLVWEIHVPAGRRIFQQPVRLGLFLPVDGSARALVVGRVPHHFDGARPAPALVMDFTIMQSALFEAATT